MILNRIEHALHRKGDQLTSKLSIVTLQEIEFKIAFTGTFISASKAKELSKEMYLSVLPTNVLWCPITGKTWNKRSVQGRLGYCAAPDTAGTDR